MNQKAAIWEKKIMIPTYEIGEAEKNPIFLDKRVYQGSSGKVYPYPTVERISEEKRDKEYTAVWLENEYLRVMVLPELGGAGFRGPMTRPTIMTSYITTM